MKPDYKIAWATIFALAVLSLSMALSAVAHGDVPTLADRIASIVPRYASKGVEPVDAGEFAAAVSTVAKGNRDWAALITTVAIHESGLAKRISENHCMNWECDSHKVDGEIQWKAAGLWQQHRNEINAATWGSSDLQVQATDAGRMLRGAFYRCQPRGKLRADWVRRTLSAYAGRQCDADWRGLTARVDTYSKIRGRL